MTDRMDDGNRISLEEMWNNRESREVCPNLYIQIELPRDWDAHPLQVAVAVERLGAALGVSQDTFLKGLRVLLEAENDS